MTEAIIEKTGKPSAIQIKPQTKPVPPSGCLLIKNHFSSVNPRDCLIRAGRYQLQPLIARPPLVLGSDFAGTVIGIGEQVEGFAFGDRVFGMKNPGEGQGTNASYVVVKATNTAHLSENVSFCQAAALPLVSLTAWQALCGSEALSKLKNKRLLILGASGGVGVHALQLALVAGATVHTVTGPDNIPMMKDLGANKAFDYLSRNYLDTDLTYDIIFDAVGKYSVEPLRHLLARDGRFTTTVPTLSFVMKSIIYKLSRCMGINYPRLSFVTVKPDPHALRAIARLVTENKLTAVIDSVYPIQDLAKAHQKVQTQRTKGKVVINISSEEGYI